MRRDPFLTLLVLSLLAASAAVGPVPVKAAPSSSPLLLLTTFTMNPVALAPGGNATANVTVTSESSAEAFGATVTLTPAAPVVLVGSGSTFFLGDLVTNTTKSFSFVVGASPSAKLGSYPVSYEVDYQDSTGAPLSSTGQIFVPVGGTPIKPQLVASSISFSPGLIAPGTTFDTAITVTNSGTDPAYASTISISPGTDVTLLGTRTVSLGTIQPGATKSVDLTMSTAPQAPTESVPVRYGLAYSDKFGLAYTTNSSYDVTITATPDLKVGSFSISSAPLRPGTFGFLTLSLINVGGDRAYDVKVVLLASTLFSGNSTNYLGAIDSGTRESAPFFFSVANTTAPGTYSLKMTLEYSDITGKPYHSALNYTVSVEPYAPPQVTLTNVLLDPPVLTPGTQGTLTLFLKNTGPTQAQNVVVTIAGGTGIVTSNQLGLGTLDPGDQVTQVIGVNVDPKLAPGSYLLTIGTTYSDPSGVDYRSSSPVQTGVYEGLNLFTPVNIGVIVLLVVVAIIALFLLRRFDLV